MIIETLLSMFAPVAVEGVKQGLSHLFGGVKPLTVDEQIKLDQNEVARLQALAALDQPGGTPSQWVIDLRASARYIAAGIVILVGASLPFMHGVSADIVSLGLEGANIAFGFLFGTRIVGSFRK